jgi:hypothetical protein
VAVEVSVSNVQDRGQEVEVGLRAGESGQHEVADAEQGEACGGGSCNEGPEDEEEHLHDVVVALEVAEGRVLAEDGGDDGGEFALAGE